MKKVIFGLVFIMSLALVVAGCAAANAQTSAPPLNGGPEAVTIEISMDEFAAQNHITKDVEITFPGSLIVSLGSNATTGYTWEDNPVISAPAVISQVSQTFVEPQDTGVVGAPGKEVWVFDSQEKGTATITFSYGQPWEGGEQAAWTLTLNITVK